MQPTVHKRLPSVCCARALPEVWVGLGEAEVVVLLRARPLLAHVVRPRRGGPAFTLAIHRAACFAAGKNDGMTMKTIKFIQPTLQNATNITQAPPISLLGRPVPALKPRCHTHPSFDVMNIVCTLLG